MSTKKETKKEVDILTVPECFAFIVGDVPCVVHFEPFLETVTFTGTGDELPKIGECLKFLREHFTHLDFVKKITVKSINW